MVIALPDGFPLAYEVMKGNTSDRSTLRDFLDKKSVFRSLKSELGIRPIYHPLELRADAHILIAFLAHCLQIILKQGLLLHAPGLTPAASAGEVSRNPNDRSVDSCRRSTVVDSAAFHATIARHQAGNREVETGAAESAAAATHCANENNEIEVQAVR